MIEWLVVNVAPQNPASGADQEGSVHGTILEVVKDLIVPECFELRVCEDGKREASPRFCGFFLGLSKSLGESAHVITADGDHLDASLAVFGQERAEFIQLIQAEGAVYPEVEV